MQNRFGPRLKILTATLAFGLGFFCVINRVPAQVSQDAAGVPTAGVAKVTREDLFKEVSMAAEFRPFQEVTLHAKVSGYVSKINVDFGDKVKAGDLMATLEVPELEAELASAQAAKQKAEADYTNAHLIYSRLQSVKMAERGTRRSRARWFQAAIHNSIPRRPPPAYWTR